MRIKPRLSVRASAASVVALGAALLAAAPAAAQNQPADPNAPASPHSAEVGVQPADAPAGSEPIVVTGSRIARLGFTTPTPVTVLGAEQIAREGSTNIAQVLNEIPAFRPQSTPATTAIFVSNLGASTADLRGLGGNRTLVLIDGRRVVASTVAGGSFTPANTVDLNLVPSSLLSRVEVVTGGASAAYGSDAVAGVTNLIINRDLQGVRTTVQFGESERGDNQEGLVSIALGSHFGGGRGRVVIGAEYVNNGGTGDCYTRDWCAVNNNTVSNPCAKPALPNGNCAPGTDRVLAGQAATIILPNARTATASLNGLIIAGPLKGTEFNSNGTTFQHNYGVTYANAGLFQSGGGDPVLPFYQYFPLSSESRRLNTFGNVDYDVSDKLNLFVQGSYGHVEGTILGASRRDISPAGAYQIRADNAFLPASVAATMAKLGLATVPFGRIWNDIGPQVGTVSRDTYRLVGGFNYHIDGSWHLDGYYQYGQTDYSQRGINTTINSRINKAVDAVRLGNGQIVCRVNADANRANDDPACIPLNPFGQNAFNPAALQYVTGTVMQDTTLQQSVAALTLRGDLINLWAGPLSFAGGVEYRKDTVTSQIDPISAANDFYTSPAGGIVGNKRSLDVKEGFVELALPLAKDLPFARSAELNGAVRVTDYSNSGRVTTWKVGGVWEPTSFLRFRGTRSRDIRAPNLFELYGAPQSSFQTVDDAKGRGLYPTLLSGNPSLVPEVADTWTIGAVVTARLGSAGTFRASADWFDISVQGAITTLGAQTIVTRCNTGSTALCNYVTRDAGGTITQIVNPNLNVNTVITRGIDFEADYTLPLHALFSDAGGNLNFRVLGTWVKDLITVDVTGTAVDRAGQNGSGVSQPSGLPDYTLNGYLSYTGDRLSLQAQVRYISKGLFQNTNIGPGQAGYSNLLANSVSNNMVPAVAYVNLNGSVTLWRDGEHRAELFGVVNNLFDKDPPNYIPSSFGPTNNVLYDVLGRSYRVGFRFTY